jgi:hypothetical protein
LRGWLQHVAANDDDWEPLHFEYGFGLSFDRNRGPCERRRTRASRSCRGGAPRRDRSSGAKHATGALRVTDHKTGRKPDSIPLYVGGGKFLQPLLYSLAAEKLVGAPVESGRLFYSTQRGEYMHALITATPQARFSRTTCREYRQRDRNGFPPAAPQKDACGICDYRVACGPL